MGERRDRRDGEGQRNRGRGRERPRWHSLEIVSFVLFFLLSPMHINHLHLLLLSWILLVFLLNFPFRIPPLPSASSCSALRLRDKTFSATFPADATVKKIVVITR